MVTANGKRRNDPAVAAQPDQDEAGENGTTLSARQELAAFALARGATILDAATDGKTSSTTVNRWLAEDAEFKKRIRQLRAEMTSRAVGIIVEGMAEAGLTLRRLLTSKSESMQHKAAESLLTHGAQLCALAELQDRVAELEGRR